MHLAMEKIMVEVDPVWRRWPLTSSHIDSFCTSAISSLVASQGPSGPNVSCDLPLVHCPRRSIWKLRSETSLQTQYPATWLSASASETYLALVPMIAAISTSQSSLVEPRGFSTASLGPDSEVLAFKKKIGSEGIGLPVSLAWSL